MIRPVLKKNLMGVSLPIGQNHFQKNFPEGISEFSKLHKESNRGKDLYHKRPGGLVANLCGTQQYLGITVLTKATIITYFYVHTGAHLGSKVIKCT